MLLQHHSDYSADVFDDDGHRVGMIAAPCPSRPHETFYPLSDYALTREQLLEVATLMQHRVIEREYGS